MITAPQRHVVGGRLDHSVVVEQDDEGNGCYYPHPRDNRPFHHGVRRPRQGGRAYTPVVAPGRSPSRAGGVGASCSVEKWHPIHKLFGGADPFSAEEGMQIYVVTPGVGATCEARSYVHLRDIHVRTWRCVQTRGRGGIPVEAWKFRVRKEPPFWSCCSA